MRTRNIGLLFLAGVSALFLMTRVLGYPDNVLFRGDQGLDMIVIRAIDQDGLRPLAGALLSVDAISVPPTFYYLMWLFYRLTGSVSGVYIGTILLSAGTLVTLSGTAFLLGGWLPAAVTALIITVSDVFYFQSLALWDPVPGIFFLSLALFFLVLTYRKNRVYALWASAFSYAFSVSVYPGPLILLPAFTLLLYRWHIRRHTGVRAALRTAAMLLLPFVTSYMPQMVSEYRRGWPTFSAIVSQSRVAGYQWTVSLVLLLENAAAFLRSVLPIENTALLVGWMWVCAYLFFRYVRRRKNYTALLFALILGAGVVTLYRGPANSHRLWAYLPPLVLAASLVLSDTLRRRRMETYAAIFVLGLYLFANGRALATLFLHPYRQLAVTRKAARVVSVDAAARHIPAGNLSFAYRTPEGKDDNELAAVWYWMRNDAGFPVPVAPLGNSLRWNTLVNADGEIIYLICESFAPQDVSPSCAEKERASRTGRYVVASRITIRPGYAVVILEKRHGENGGKVPPTQYLLPRQP